MEAAAHLAVSPANENATEARLVLCVSDPEGTVELQRREEGSDRDGLAKHPLRIGVLALRQASGALDSQSIQREGERMLASVREALSARTLPTSGVIAVLATYLDPASRSLPQRLDRLMPRDGEIESLRVKHLDGAHPAEWRETVLGALPCDPELSAQQRQRRGRIVDPTTRPVTCT